MHLEIDDDALAEAVEARDYYEALRPELGRDFVAMLDQAVGRVLANPLAWPPCTQRTRRYLMHRFPYPVIYRVKGDIVRILAVSHQHRRPGYWTKRLQRS